MQLQPSLASHTHTGSLDIIPSLSSVACLRHKERRGSRAAAAAFDVCSRQNNVAASPAAAAAASFLSQFASPPPLPSSPRPASHTAELPYNGPPTSAAPSLQLQSHSQSKFRRAIQPCFYLSANFSSRFQALFHNKTRKLRVFARCLSSGIHLFIT